jgi:predicted MarR family transcription regulator
MSRFLDARIVETLNEHIEDSGSEDVSEMEYSPSESYSDSGMWSRIGMGSNCSQGPIIFAVTFLQECYIVLRN